MISTLTLDLPEVDRKAVLRYMGCKELTADVEKLITEAEALLQGKLLGKVCYSEYGIEIYGDDIDLGFAKVKSRSLARNLKDCRRIVLFAATVGIEADRLILKYTKIKPSLAVCIQALGAERVEALCDSFEEMLKAQKPEIKLHPRFSPGYGDLDIGLQTEIFKALDCYKHIGITLNENMLISPTKSVTAIIGIEENNL